MEPLSRRKIRQGVVVSNKMDKTVVVEVTRSIRHPRYNKIVKRSKRLKAHDEENKCSIGDTVEIWETRPLSKDKRWRVVRILKKAQLGEALIEEKEGEMYDTAKNNA